MTISNQARDRVRGAFEPIALALGRLGLTPDGLTLIGFGITVVGAVLLSQQQWLAGGLVVLFGGLFDMFDGTLARATGKVSKLGAFMDSVFDRWGEAIVYLGIALGAVGWHGQSEIQPTFIAILAAAAMGSAFMVSYVRAKSEGLGFTPGTGMAAVGIMPREVRLVILCLGLVLAGLTVAGHTSFPSLNVVLIGETPIDLDAGHGYLAIALTVIAIGSTITTIQRILHVRAQANREASSRPTEQEHP